MHMLDESAEKVAGVANFRNPTNNMHIQQLLKLTLALTTSSFKEKQNFDKYDIVGNFSFSQKTFHIFNS